MEKKRLRLLTACILLAACMSAAHGTSAVMAMEGAVKTGQEAPLWLEQANITAGKSFLCVYEGSPWYIKSDGLYTAADTGEEQMCIGQFSSVCTFAGNLYAILSGSENAPAQLVKVNPVSGELQPVASLSGTNVYFLSSTGDRLFINDDNRVIVMDTEEATSSTGLPANAFIMK